MFEKGIIFILTVFSLLFFVTPFAVNVFYKRKAARFLDEMLAENTAEFNRQIRTNAAILLVRRSLWALLFLSGLIWNFRVVWERGFNRLTAVFILLGLACFAFGIWGYKTEIKRLKTLE